MTHIPEAMRRAAERAGIDIDEIARKVLDGEVGVDEDMQRHCVTLATSHVQKALDTYLTLAREIPNSNRTVALLCWIRTLGMVAGASAGAYVDTGNQNNEERAGLRDAVQAMIAGAVDDAMTQSLKHADASRSETA